MPRTATHCIPEQFTFGQVESRQVIVNFKGGTVTSDAGLTLIAALVAQARNNPPAVKLKLLVGVERSA